MVRSSFNEVSAFLQQTSGETPPPAEMEDDIDLVVRRWERVRDLGEAFDRVELSPYMQSLLQTRDRALATVESERASAAAGG